MSPRVSGEGHVWYVSYGSNMSAARLACYLCGGRPPGGSRTNPGARDASPPLRTSPVDLPGTLYFAGQSPQWGGGVAFYDHATPGFAAARGYLITVGQLVDINAQEMYREPVGDEPLELLLRRPLPGGRHRLGVGRYETLVEVGLLDGRPLLTFTSPDGAADVEHTKPSRRYLEAMAAGLREARGWGDVEVDDYLAGVLPGR